VVVVLFLPGGVISIVTTVRQLIVRVMLARKTRRGGAP
jgi:hypothetical protein